MSDYAEVVARVVTAVEAIGASIMVIGGAAVLLRHVWSTFTMDPSESGYELLRRDLGRLILLGLEVLIIADIVRTIAVESSIQTVAILGAVVLIRTVLSFSIDIEIDGQLPWRKHKTPNTQGTDEDSP